jgi:hypothetical protein
MGLEELICRFVERAGEDPRMGPSHISLYLAILFVYRSSGYYSPVSIYSRTLMKLAKFSSAGTYHRCIGDLRDGGFIRYVPSYNPVLGSLVYVL